METAESRPNDPRKRTKKPPTKQERQMMKQIQAMPPMNESQNYAIYERVIGDVLNGSESNITTTQILSLTPQLKHSHPQQLPKHT
ncbi:hypothetical protein GCM10027577_39660 [Spirosoma fluminis]